MYRNGSRDKRSTDGFCRPQLNVTFLRTGTTINTRQQFPLPRITPTIVTGTNYFRPLFFHISFSFLEIIEPIFALFLNNTSSWPISFYHAYQQIRSYFIVAKNSRWQRAGWTTIPTVNSTVRIRDRNKNIMELVTSGIGTRK